MLWRFMNILHMFGCLRDRRNSSGTELHFVLQHTTNIIKSNHSTLKKVIEVSALNPCNSFAAKCFNFVFYDINTDGRFGFYRKNESTLTV